VGAVSRNRALQRQKSASQKPEGCTKAREYPVASPLPIEARLGARSGRTVQGRLGPSQNQLFAGQWRKSVFFNVSALGRKRGAFGTGRIGRTAGRQPITPFVSPAPFYRWLTRGFSRGGGPMQHDRATPWPRRRKPVSGFVLPKVSSNRTSAGSRMPNRLRSRSVAARFAVSQLKAAIQEFIEAHQANPKPSVWTKSADEILASIARFAQRTVDARAAQQMSRTTVTGH
jgi:hypothetical protein